MKRYLVRYRDYRDQERTVVIPADVPMQFRGSLEEMKPFIGQHLQPKPTAIVSIEDIKEPSYNAEIE